MKSFKWLLKKYTVIQSEAVAERGTSQLTYNPTLSNLAEPYQYEMRVARHKPPNLTVGTVRHSKKSCYF